MITKKKDITALCDNITVNSETGHLMFAGRDTVDLAKRYGTPLYLIDEDHIRKMCRIYLQAMKEAFDDHSKPLFASKALCFKKIADLGKKYLLLCWLWLWCRGWLSSCLLGLLLLGKV